MYYYQHHIGDYRRDTSHLTILEHGAYRQLLDLYYISEKPLDANALRLVCARTADEVKAVEQILCEFFTLKNGKYYHKRCEDEILRFHSKSTKAKEPKVKEAGEAKMPRKKKEKEEKQEMPDMVSKAEKREKLVVKHEKEKRVESAEAKGKGKKGAVLM
jgi:uncharacterized protein YdaU (DUF1376 family)